MELNRFLHRETTGAGPATTSAIRTVAAACPVDLVQFSHAENSFLEEGKSGPYEGWLDPKRRLRIALVRDLETLLPHPREAITSNPVPSEAVPLMNHWEPSNSEGIRLRMLSPPSQVVPRRAWTAWVRSAP